MDLQGALIERLSGQTLPDFMRSEIFAPLGMADTDFYVPSEKLPAWPPSIKTGREPWRRLQHVSPTWRVRDRHRI